MKRTCVETIEAMKASVCAGEFGDEWTGPIEVVITHRSCHEMKAIFIGSRAREAGEMIERKSARRLRSGGRWENC